MNIIGVKNPYALIQKAGKRKIKTKRNRKTKTKKNRKTKTKRHGK